MMAGKSMMKTEIVIIGAGIAGNYLAMRLREEHIPCVIIEKHKSLEARPLQCAGIISQKIETMVNFPKEIILNRVSKVKIITPNNLEIMLQGNEQPVIIDRINFDAFFGQQAHNMGAKYLFREEYKWHKKIKSNKVLVHTNRRNIICNLVIGADGPGSRVGKQFNHVVPSIAAAQVRAKFKYPLNQTCMIFSKDWKELFGYVVPEGNSGICRIGIASKTHPGKKIKEFFQYLSIVENHIIDRQGGLIPFGFPDQLVFDKTLLIGDAAGMVKATTGGGIIMTIAASKILFRSLKMAYYTQNYSEIHFKKTYQQPFMRKLGVELFIHYIIRLFLINMSSSEFNQLFALITDNSIKSIIETKADMDFPLKMMIKLIFTPAFVKMGIVLFIHHLSLMKKIIIDLMSLFRKF